MLDLIFPNPTTCAVNNLKVQIAVTHALALLQEQQVQVTKSDLGQQSLAQCTLLTQYGKWPVSLKAWWETIIMIIYPGQKFPPEDLKASYTFSCFRGAGGLQEDKGCCQQLPLINSNLHMGSRG